jgi:hypothetical protein
MTDTREHLVKSAGWTIGTVRWTFDAGWVARHESGAEIAGFGNRADARRAVYEMDAQYEEAGQ